MYHVFNFGLEAREKANINFNRSSYNVCDAFLRMLLEVFFYTRLSKALNILKPYHLLHRQGGKYLPFLPPHSRKLENQFIRVRKVPSVFYFVSVYAAENAQRSIKKSGRTCVADLKSLFDGRG